MKEISLFVWLIAASLFHFSAFAQSNNRLSEKEQLIKEICPDLYKDKSTLFAHKVIQIRGIDSSYTTIYDLSEKKQIDLEGYLLTPQYIIILASIYPSFSSSYDFQEGITILAIFDKKTQKILDAQNVKHDKITYIHSLKNQSLFEVGKNSYVLLIHNHHFGGGAGYNLYSLFLISPKIIELDTIFSINYNCFTPKPISLITYPSKKKFYDIDLSFNIQYGKNNCTETTDIKRQFPEILKGKYKWDDKKSKYINSIKDFNILSDWSESNL